MASNERRDLVSIITPTYNSSRYLPETIDAVLGQTYQNWELLICDDGSSDETLDVIRERSSSDDRIRQVGATDRKGPAEARNLAIEAAAGRFIAFLDSDDLWLPKKLEKQIRFMNETGCGLSYTGYQKIDASGKIIGKPVAVPPQVCYEELLRGPVIACLTAMYDRERVGKVLMPRIRKRQDFALWLKILTLGQSARGLQENLALYRITPDSLSRNKLSAAWYVWKVYRNLEKLSIPKSVACFIGYSLKGVRKSANR